MKFPLGLHARGCSSPAIGVDVDWRVAERVYMRRVLFLLVPAWFLDGEGGEEGWREETTKKAPSPRQLIRGKPSSSSFRLIDPALLSLVFCVEGDSAGVSAAALPAEPWN